MAPGDGSHGETDVLPSSTDVHSIENIVSQVMDDIIDHKINGDQLMDQISDNPQDQSGDQLAAEEGEITTSKMDTAFPKEVLKNRSKDESKSKQKDKKKDKPKDKTPEKKGEPNKDESKSRPRTIYVGNLHQNATENDVKKHFQGCGTIKYVAMPGKCYAFVEFIHPQSVKTAIDMFHGTKLMGRPIKVKERVESKKEGNAKPAKKESPAKSDSGSQQGRRRGPIMRKDEAEKFDSYRAAGGYHQPASPPPVKELNVLILGETGVGKSTWINSIVNYITFPTLDQAIECPELEWLITSSFRVITKDGNRLVQKEIVVGNEVEEKHEMKHENTAVGESATQFSRPYVITLDEGTIIRLIDTPGIGDTRGADQDKLNFENILHTINRYEQLHGIVILLKPNSARLTVMFRFVVQELLTHLHKSAAQNIVFGFTNTRSTHYMPGDTFPALEKLLKELAERGGSDSILIPLTPDTVYNYDSESFRYLAALKQGADLGERDDYRKSWTRSVKELKRMLLYMSTLVPHQITDTDSLNSCRQLITELTKPMAEISRNITLNIKMNEAESKDLAETKAKGYELLKMLKVKRIDLNAVELNQPVTVCTKSECIEVRTCGERQVTVYKTRCHNPCYLQNVRVDTINTAELLQCWAIRNGVCHQCGHGYQDHMHVLYYHEEIEVEVEDEGISRKIKASATDAQLKQTAIATRNRLVAEYRAEQVIIEKANAKFGHYLKENSITPYNDARLAYLEHLIKQENEKLYVLNTNSHSTEDAAKKRVRAMVEALETSAREYVEYVAILDAAMKTGEGEEQPLTDPKQVLALAKSLFGLKHFGQALKDNKDGVVRSYRRTGISNNHLINEVYHKKKNLLSYLTGSSSSSGRKKGGKNMPNVNNKYRGSGGGDGDSYRDRGYYDRSYYDDGYRGSDYRDDNYRGRDYRDGGYRDEGYRGVSAANYQHGGNFGGNYREGSYRARNDRDEEEYKSYSGFSLFANYLPSSLTNRWRSFRHN